MPDSANENWFGYHASKEEARKYYGTPQVTPGVLRMALSDYPGKTTLESLKKHSRLGLPHLIHGKLRTAEHLTRIQEVGKLNPRNHRATGSLADRTLGSRNNLPRLQPGWWLALRPFR